MKQVPADVMLMIWLSDWKTEEARESAEFREEGILISSEPPFDKPPEPCSMKLVLPENLTEVLMRTATDASSLGEPQFMLVKSYFIEHHIFW